jgi:hypothetical protein
MQAFRDGSDKAHEWLLHINVASIRRVRAATGVDLAALPASGLGEFLSDVVKFVDVLWVLVEPQAKERGVSDEDFGASLSGDSLVRAAEAFVEELIDFFPAPRRGPLREMVKKGRQLDDVMARMAGEEMARFDPEAEAEKTRKRLKQQRESLESGSGEPSGGVPESSASTPESSPSES